MPICGGRRGRRLNFLYVKRNAIYLPKYIFDKSNTLRGQCIFIFFFN
jgi:hypothetical protein